MHRAFEATVGCALFAGKLEPLYAARPGLRAMAPEIEDFFAASRRSFFAVAEPAPATLPEPLDRWVALCHRLARLEGGEPAA